MNVNPLVNSYIKLWKDPAFCSWENSRTKWWFSIVMLNYHQWMGTCNMQLVNILGRWHQPCSTRFHHVNMCLDSTGLCHYISHYFDCEPSYWAMETNNARHPRLLLIQILTLCAFHRALNSDQLQMISRVICVLQPGLWVALYISFLHVGVELFKHGCLPPGHLQPVHTLQNHHESPRPRAAQIAAGLPIKIRA